MPGYYKYLDIERVCQSNLFHAISNIKEPSYIKPQWGIFDIVPQYGTNKFLERSYFLTIGEPITKLRPNSIWDTVSQFLMFIREFYVDTRDQIKFESRTAERLILLALEPIHAPDGFVLNK